MQKAINVFEEETEYISLIYSSNKLDNKLA